MPTRILYWNIRDFARNKIDNPNSRKRKRGSSLKEADASFDRFSHILWLIDQVDPDIIVVVETETAYDAPGRLVRGNGGEGARTLLTGVRNQLNDNNWMLVPPLQTGPNEAVSVLYNSFRRYFTGPYVWPGGGVATAAPPGGGTGNYPVIWQNRLPNRNIPAGAQYNGGTPERRKAARIAFTESAAAANAGMAINYNNFRAPYMTTFTEVDGGNNVVRDISLFSIHAPASFNARQYLRDLAENAQIVDGIANDEVRVVLGDFNVNLLRDNHTQAVAYLDLVVEGYALELAPAGAPPNPVEGYPGYFGTHMVPANQASFWSTLNDDEFYPGYGYIGGATDYAIDNVYTQYGANQNPPINNNFTIMNAVAGSPFDFVNAPAGNPPEGSLVLAQEMENPPAIADPANLHQAGMATSFRAWEQYGHIYSVSDHLALAIDI
jgi:hypothetical protein